MTIKVTQTNTEAEFSGIGAEVNNYMKFRLFPKGGSYLEAGGNLRGDFVSTKALVDSLAAIRMHTLDTLSNVSDAFKSWKQHGSKRILLIVISVMQVIQGCLPE